jgi:hypothetical protein
MPEYTHDEIKKLLDESTPGEWKWITRDLDDQPVNVGIDGVLWSMAFNGDYDPDSEIMVSESDAELIANAPAIIRQLLSENERLKKISDIYESVGGEYGVNFAEVVKSYVSDQIKKEGTEG